MEEQESHARQGQTAENEGPQRPRSAQDRNIPYSSSSSQTFGVQELR